MTRSEKVGFVRVMSLLGSRFPLYLGGGIVRGLTLAFCFNVVMAFVFKDVLNASMGGDGSLLLRGVVLALGTFVLGMPAVCFGWYGIMHAVFWTASTLRQRLFDRLVRVPLAFLDERHSGDLVSRSTNDLQAALLMYAWLGNGVQGISMGVIGMASIFVLEWRLGFVGLGIGGAMMLVSALLARVIRRRSDELQRSLGGMVERLSDLLAGLWVTRMFQQEDAVHAVYATASNEVAEASIAVARTQARHDALQEILDWLQTIGVPSLALFFFGNGVLLVGAVWAIVRLQGNASAFFLYVGQYVTAIQRGMAGGERVIEILDEPDEHLHVDRSEPALPYVPAEIDVRNLCFSYPGGNGESPDAVLRDVSLTVAEGSLVAVVGPSGGGKSTLVKLLLGFYPDYGGRIVVKGRRQSEYSLRELRETMAYVAQDAHLLDGTVEENIAFGRPEASFDEIEAAARAAHADEFIRAQPDGYQTQVGEGGARLSGGQRQRIAIARALLRNAPILLLDEATSALDSESEKLVQDALDVLMRGRTTIAIAHRLSTIEHADRIVVLDEGRVIEEGDHEELLAAGNLYQRLHQLQFAT